MAGISSRLHGNKTNLPVILLYIFVIAIISPPIISILFELKKNDTSYDNHHLLISVINTLLLGCSVSISSSILGSTAAWIVGNYNFFGRNILKYALVLPLTIPIYISGYMYYQFFAKTNQIHLISNILHVNKMQLSYIYNFLCAIFVMTMAYYPYVYILSLNRLRTMSDSIIIARSLGYKGWKLFTDIAIHIMRPALFLGIIMVIIEVITEYGLTSYYGLNTIINLIYRLWFNARDYVGAAKTALMALILVAVISFIEHRAKKYSHNSSIINDCLQQVRGGKAALMFGYCFVIIYFSFLFPFLELIKWSMAASTFKILTLIINSVLFSSIVAIAAIFISLVIGYIANQNTTNGSLFKIIGIGYAIPGSIIAIGILNSNRITQYANIFSIIFKAGTFGLLYACLYRFIGISYNTIDEGFKQINDDIKNVITIYCKRRYIGKIKVYTPLIASNVAIVFALIFIDMIKELPITLILRPFNYDTLSTKIYEYISDERYYDAALPSIVIILISVVMLRGVFYRIK